MMIYMNKILLGCCMLCTLCSSAQQAFPVKVNKKWGLIDATGSIILPPAYEAIGEFKHFGYAIMQRGGKIGLLDQRGQEVIRPVYEDLKMLDATRAAVMDAGQWMIVDLQGRTILDKGYEQVKVLHAGCLAFMKGKKWGVVDSLGRVIAPPAFDDIRESTQGYFTLYKAGKIGLVAADGREIVPPLMDNIQPFSDSLFFFQSNGYWGAADAKGKVVIPARFDAYYRISEHFVKLMAKEKTWLYSIACASVLTAGEYDNFLPFSRRLVLARKGKLIGVLDWCGGTVLEPAYDEIQPLGLYAFRVQRQGKWGILEAGGKPLTPFRYDYIAPASGMVTTVKLNGRFGLLNLYGEEIAAPVFLRIEMDGTSAKAYQKTESGERLTLLEWDEEGRLSDNNNFNQHFRVRISSAASARRTITAENNFLLEEFEWFYAPAKDRWGLRRLSDGSIQIEPKFNFIYIYPEFGFTLAGMPQVSRGEFERTTFRFETAWALVSHSLGRLVTEPVLLDVRIQDFQAGYPVARCTFADGRHGLIDKSGRILKKDLAYIGEFSEGLARFATGGSLSGSLKPQGELGRLKDYLGSLKSPAIMVDYTDYDQIFQREAWLICRDCHWGYIDTQGVVQVSAQYTFARDFINGVGIVECDGKWGMVNRKADIVLPCRYDGVQFLENTDNRIIRIYIQQPKYGLIDTLGRLTVSAIYDEIGSFREGRLAVKRNGLWGFVDIDGVEVIPCRFREAQAFNEGRAPVRLGRFWGYIDKQGDTEIEFKFARAGRFSQGLAWVTSTGGYYYYIDTAGRQAIRGPFERAYEFQQGLARVVVNKKMGIIDTQGKFVLKPKYFDIQAFDEHGLALASLSQNPARYGLINQSGQIVTRRAYTDIRPFSEGLAAVRFKDRCGFIDTTGRLAFAGAYARVSDFSNGRAVVQAGGRCGYIDAQGNPVTPLEYTRCLDYEQDRAIAYKNRLQPVLLNLEGDPVMEPGLNTRLLRFSEGRGLARTDNYSFYYLTEQNSPYAETYQQASPFRHGVAVVETNGKWGVIDQRGIAIIPPKYDRIETFENGYAKVRILGFSGLTNLNGELIVQPDYEYITYAGGGLFRVEQGDKIGYFDQKGRWVWDLAK